MASYMTDLSMNFESTCVLIQLDVGDAIHVSSKLYIGSVSSNGQTHQVISHTKLFCVARSDLGTLKEEIIQ